MQPTVTKRMRQAATAARPAETGGLVSGRCFRDEEGPYTVVLDALEAPEESRGLGHIRMSAELTGRLRTVAAKRQPSMDVVGWWHTHMFKSSYSSTDLANQRLWTDAGHIGLLVFASGWPWATAYSGPESTPMHLKVDWTPEPLSLEADLRIDVRPVQLTRQLPAARDRRSRQAVVAASLGGALAGTLLLSGYGLAAATRTEGPRLGWSCQVSARGVVDCVADVTSPGRLEWRVGGRPAGLGPTLRFQLPSGTRQTVSLVLRDPQGEIVTGTISVGAVPDEAVPAGTVWPPAKPLWRG